MWLGELTILPWPCIAVDLGHKALKERNKQKQNIGDYMYMVAINP